MEKFVLTREEKSNQNKADLIKNNLKFIESYSNNKLLIYQTIISKYYDSLVKFGYPYYEENGLLQSGNHVIFDYESSDTIDIKLVTELINEDLKDNLGIYFPDVEFKVSINLPGYVFKNNSGTLLKKRNHIILDVGIYQSIKKIDSKNYIKKQI